MAMTRKSESDALVLLEGLFDDVEGFLSFELFLYEGYNF
jgi:hypothetical protein